MRVIIFRYLIKEVYGTLLASTLVLLLLLISNQFVHYLTAAAAGAVPLHTVLQIMSLQVPLLLGLLLPLGLYLGILMAYGRLYADREMTTLFACGLSHKQLIGMTLAFSGVVCMVVALLMFWVQPLVESYKRQIYIEAATSSPLERIIPGQFTPIQDLVFYAQKLSRDHKQLQQIFAAQRGKKPDASGLYPWTLVIAHKGQQAIDAQNDDKFLVLKEGYRYSGVPGAADWQVAQYASYGVRIEQNAIPEDKRAETIPTLHLWQQRHNNPKYEAELQWRFALPISVLLLALLALSLSKVNPRQGRYAQLLPAFLLYIIYADLIFVGRAWLQKGKIAPELGLWWVHGSLLVIVILLLMRYVGFKSNWARRGRKFQ